MSRNRLAVFPRLAYASDRKPGEYPPGSVRGVNLMKIWTKPAVRETEVGLEVTSYLPAEIDVI